MSWMRHNLTLVTHSMWSFWGWVEQSTLKCIDLCFFIIIIVIIIIFNGGNPPVTNPHHYHYCQNPTMVGFWLVGICRLAIVITIISTITITTFTIIIIMTLILITIGTGRPVPWAALTPWERLRHLLFTRLCRSLPHPAAAWPHYETSIESLGTSFVCLFGSSSS